MKQFLFYNKLRFAFLLFFKMIYAAGYVGFALILQFAINTVTATNATLSSLLICVGIMLGYMAIALVIMLIKDKYSTSYINSAVMHLRDSLVKKLLDSKYQDFAKQDSSAYLSNLTNDIKVIATNYFTSILNIPDEFFTFIFAVAAAFYINYLVAITMLGLTLLIFLVPIIFNKPLNKSNLQLSNAIKNYTKALKQTFAGIDVVKNFNCQQQMYEEIQTINKSLSKCNSKIDRLNAFALDVGIFLVILLQIGSIAISGYMLIIGVLTIGSVIAVVQLGNNLFTPIMQVSGKLALVKGVGELNKTILQIINVEPEMATQEFNFQKLIDVKDVSYSYGENQTPVLRNINITFEKGKKYLLLGKSGSGKSTLLKLIAKMYNNFDGQIAVDGVDYSDIKEKSLYEYVGIAQQKSYLFDTNIRNNIDFNKIGNDELLDFAIKNAELTTFVSSQPNGLQEIINEEVNQISGGEKLRIGLARVLYRNTDILLLDEVTSALDKDTAHKVENNMLSLKNKTIINVSHKIHLDLIDKYNMVCIIENGSIVSMAPPKEIVNTLKFKEYTNEMAASETM